MKNTTFTFLFLLTAFWSFSQGWERFYGENSPFDRAYDAIQLPDGDYLISGNGGAGQASSITRTDELGFEKWHRFLPAGFNGAKMFPLPSGNIALLSTDRIIEIDTAANVMASNTISPAIPIQYVFQVIDGFVATVHSNPGTIQIWKIDTNGSLVWQKDVLVSGIYPGGRGTASPDGGFVFVGQTPADVRLVKFDADGNVEWTTTGGTPDVDGYNMFVTATSDGGYAVGADGAGSNYDQRVFKFDGSGNLLWWGEHIRPSPYSLMDAHFITEMIETSDGGIAIAAYLLSGDYSFPTVVKFSNTGNVDFFHANPRRGVYNSILQANDGGYHAVGRGNNDPESFSILEAYAIKLGPTGQFFAGYLNGRVAFDENLDCLISTTDSPLKNWVVKASGVITSYDLTDADGNYFIGIGAGPYTVEVIPPNDLWSLCESPAPVLLSNVGDTLSTDFSIQAAVDCPAMHVDIGVPFLRRCFSNNITVQYCNFGTVSAEDAFIEVTLDNLLEIESSSIPFSGQTDNTYTFPLNDVAVGACGSFQIVALLHCDAQLGQTMCIEAHAFPDTICGIPFNWSGASMMARAKCQGDTTVVLELENVGTAPTSEALDYIVIEDQIIFMQDSEVFDPMEVETILMPANGATWRITSEQEPNHPGTTIPTAFVEGCGTGPSAFSFDFINEHPLGDGDGFIDIDCELIIGAYDPNDKLGLPKGYGNQHYIEPNTDLEYRIRFQNTGTDTAFTVVIRDTLSPFLDPVSLRAGAASHNYEFDLEGDAVAIFRFENILLPDSNVNEALSHGFVSFRISQKPDVALESVIENEAAIYFDFNDPVITNRVFHTVGRNFIEVSTDINELPEGLGALLTYPNPSAGAVMFEIPSAQPVKATFILYDQFGRLVLRKGFEGQHFLFNGHDHPKEIYFYKVEVEGLGRYSGKVVLK